MKTIPLSNSTQVAIVDDNVYDQLINLGEWYVNNNGYAIINGRRAGKILLHTLIFEPKPGEEIDHKNGNKLDNRIENLRSVPHHLNTLLHATRNAKNDLARGITLSKSGRFCANLKWKGQPIYLGTFDTLEQATEAYNQKHKQLVCEAYGPEMAEETSTRRSNYVSCV